MAGEVLRRGVDDAVDVAVPKFRMEYETTMNEALIALGMQSAFGLTPDTDFTGLSPAGRDLYISNVKQKTFIAVDEIGTEAAAVTSVDIRVTSLGPHIFLDRPFVFAIRERLSGTILFVGVIAYHVLGRPMLPAWLRAAVVV